MSRLIFIVDDVPDVRGLAATFVEGMGFRALTFRDGMSVIEYLDTPTAEKPDLVLTDIEMPRLNGIELKKRLVSLLPGVPVLIMTGMSRRDVQREFPEEAANIIEKPFYREDIEVAVYRALAKPLPEEKK